MEGMSAEEMRNALYERLHNKGLLDLLKVGLTKCFMLAIVFRMFCSNVKMLFSLTINITYTYIIISGV